MANILITSAGQRVSLVRAFQKELKVLINNSKVYTVDFNPHLAPACHVSDGYKAIGRVTDKSYIEDLIKLCKEWNIKLIVPTIDTELVVLAKNKTLLLQSGIIAVVSDLSFIQKCRDKRIINQFFTTRGIDIPREISKTDPTFPLFLKPYDGSLSKDIFLITNSLELNDIHLENPKLMYMEYISLVDHDEYTVDAYYNCEGILKCAVPRKRIFVRSGEINKGTTCKNEIESCLKEKLAVIPGASGCLTLQFFLNRKTKRIIGIEINPRFGGGFPLSYLAGANFPKWLIEEYIFEEQIQFFDGWEDKLLMLRYDDEILIHNYEG